MSVKMRAPEVIATHGNTDFDAFAAMLAARRLYPNAVVCVAGSLNRNVREFYRLHADELDIVDASRLELDAIRRLIVVETLQAARLGELEPVAHDPAVEKVVFDHHAGVDLPDWVAPESAVLSDDGALTTTLVGVLAEREISVTPLEATVFALGIHEDTGSLTYASATQRDADGLAWCLRHGARQAEIATYLHTPLAEGERELLSTLLAALESRVVAGVEVLIGAVSWPEHVDGISNLAHKIVDLTDCKGLVLLVEMEDRVFCVARSRTPELDAAEVARILGGGGHAQAASAIFRGPLEEARTRLVEGFDAAIREPLLAREIMSRPARSVSPDAPVSEAMVVCQRYGQSGILVVEDGRLAGAASREDLDKAISHGLGHAPVKGIMSSRVLTCDRETPLGELQRLVGLSPDGRVAVLEDGHVVGVVTRSDLLRALGAREEADAEPAPSLREELDRLEHLAPVFEAVAAVSEPYDGVYLVGGTVRDILLGEPNFDIDIAVEGDAIALAEALAEALDGRARPHEKFGTAVVLFGEGEHVDVVTARTEFYDAPAALPTVEHASMREDLFRRDFTINAMAVSLKGDDLGRLFDPFGGRRDLDAGRIRVLHNLSFIDDPTRIFRAVRYESRYGFRMDEHTFRLARGCIEMGLVGDLSGTRLREDLIELLDEADPGRSILRLAELGAGRAIHPHLAADEEAVRLLERLRELNERYGLEIPLWRLGLTALARDLPPDELYDWLERLKVRRRDAEQIASAVTAGPLIAEHLRWADVTPAEVVAVAEPYAPDAPLLALALADLQPLHDYFGRLGRVRLEITGSDVADLGLGESPRVGEILAELRTRKLNGELDGRESELAAARELIESS
jgi:tRNA nucleotidyltransferase (CCA-adding enzyme)